MDFWAPLTSNFFFLLPFLLFFTRWLFQSNFRLDPRLLRPCNFLKFESVEVGRSGEGEGTEVTKMCAKMWIFLRGEKPHLESIWSQTLTALIYNCTKKGKNIRIWNFARRKKSGERKFDAKNWQIEWEKSGEKIVISKQGQLCCWSIFLRINRGGREKDTKKKRNWAGGITNNAHRCCRRIFPFPYVESAARGRHGFIGVLQINSENWLHKVSRQLLTCLNFFLLFSILYPMASRRPRWPPATMWRGKKPIE